jgi:hypothetical protein
VCLGCYGYFGSPWVRKNLYEICDDIKAVQGSESSTDLKMDISCPSLAMEKFFVLVTLFCFTLSFMNIIGSLFSKQVYKGEFKLEVRYF